MEMQLTSANMTYITCFDCILFIYIDHILPALILLCPSKPMACTADRPIYSFIRLKMGKGHQGEPHQTVNQNHCCCTKRYMWKTPRTGEMNPTYREKSFQMVISKSFPFFLKRRWKKPGGGVVVASSSNSSRGSVVILCDQLLPLLILF